MKNLTFLRKTFSYSQINKSFSLYFFILSLLFIGLFSIPNVAAQQIQQYKAIPEGSAVMAPIKGYNVIAGTTDATLLYGSSTTYSYPSYNNVLSFTIPFDFKYGTKKLVGNSDKIYISPAWNYVMFGDMSRGNGNYPISSYGGNYYQPFYNTNYYADNAVCAYGGNYNTSSYVFCYAYSSNDNAPARGIWYKVEGTAPNRVLTIEFYRVGNYYWDYAGSTSNMNNNSSYYRRYRSFQVKLYETTGTIEFHYGPRTTEYYTSTGYHYTFLMGNTYSDCQIMYRTDGGTPAAWNQPYRWTGTANGYLNSTSYSHYNYEYWFSGTYYQFSPNVPTNLVINSQTSTQLDLSWTASSFGESTWSLEYGPKGFAPGSGTVVTATTNVNFMLPISNLIPDKEYDLYVYAYSDGVWGEGTASNKVSFSTACATSLYQENMEDFSNYEQGLPNGCWINIQDSSMATIGGTGEFVKNVVSYNYTLSDWELEDKIYQFNYNGADGTDGSVQKWVVPENATVAKFEVWGAEGGYYNNNYFKSGKGGYSSGSLNLYNKHGDTLYIYVGGQGKLCTVNNSYFDGGGYNGGGGGAYGYGGGGGTDVRTVKDNLYSRFIVAGGGGGASGYPQTSYSTYNYAPDAGSVTGRNGYSTSSSYYVTGGSQIAGGTPSSYHWQQGEPGSFGRGGLSAPAYQEGSYYGPGGGGGGWFGGAGGNSQTTTSYGRYNTAGGGGSGYVYTSGNEGNYPIGRLIDSDYYLASTSMYSGYESMPTPEGGSAVGRSGHGAVKITCTGYKVEQVDSTITPVYASNCLKIDGRNGEAVVASPALQFDNGASLGDHLLHFKAMSTNSATIYVGTIENEQFVVIDSVTPTESGLWEEYVVRLHNYTGTGNQIAFRSQNAANYVTDVWMEIENTAPCAYPPMGLTVSNVATDSAVIYWESFTDTETSYTVEYGEGDFVQGQGNSTIVNGVTDTFFVLNNLDAGTMYTFYIRTNCGDTLRTEYSKISFSTECQYTIPFIEDFDNFTADRVTNCWVLVGDERTPIVRNIEANSAPNALALTLAQGDSCYVRFPDLGSSDVTNVIFSMDVYAPNFTVIEIGYLDANGDFQRKDAIFHLFDNVWKSYIVAPVTGEIGKYFALKVLQMGDVEPIYIDNISISKCASPTNVTVNSFDSDRMNISWTAGDAETNWNVKIGEVGFDPEQAGRLITATDNDKDSLDITNLQSNTIYEIYVQADCGSGDVSTWSLPAVCTTKNTVAQVPYTCNFENSNERNAWYFANGNETNTNKWYIGRAQNTNNGGNYGMYISNDGGFSNAYDTEGKATIAHAYREFYMPESNSYQLTFDWKSAGAENDYLNVYLLPANQLPLNGEMPDDSYKINATPFYNNQNLTCSYVYGDTVFGQLTPGGVVDFDYTGGVQTWTVPTGLTSATLEVWGAQGGTVQTEGGRGGYAKGTLNNLRSVGELYI